MGHSKQSTGEVEVDLGRYELRRFGRRIKLEKKPMELLIFLLERREQMVSREDIVKKLWRSDLFIDTEKNVNNVVRKLRTALGDSADTATLSGNGSRKRIPIRRPGSGDRCEISALGFWTKLCTQRPSGKMGANGANGLRSPCLPLLLLEKATDDQGLCLGFADALVSRLGNLPGVDVLPTSAVLNLPLEANSFGNRFSSGRPICCPRRHSDVKRAVASLAGDV